MSFNSFEFVFFFIFVFFAYWTLARRGSKLCNVFLVFASYFFYGWWDYRFLSLIIISSTCDYTVGRLIFSSNSPRNKKILLIASVSINLFILGVFKYFNFFADSLAAIMSSFGIEPSFVTLNIVLPAGISFYTFQTMTYSIDIYRGQMRPTKEVVAFFAYVAFFPQLVAGPIERANRFLPQFLKRRTLTWGRISDGSRQIISGLLKKMVVADNLAPHVDYVFSNYNTLDSASLLTGGVFFAFQIYGDFSGYSDMAIGTARLLGFDLSKNFDYPYFSRNIAEFWRRWHISLSTWFRDYLYIPLGGSIYSSKRTLFNILTTFLLCGLWHGASWKFVVWGMLHALYFIPLVAFGKHHVAEKVVAHDKILPGIKDVLSILLTFSAVVIAWIFFRADSLTDSVLYLSRIISGPLLSSDHERFYQGFSIIAVFLLLEWIKRRDDYFFDIKEYPLLLRHAFYYMAFFTLIMLGRVDHAPFIYYQF